jgi:hypothetical protein
MYALPLDRWEAAKRLVALLAVVGALFTIYAQANPPKAAAQDHYEFCYGTLAPYGQYGDRCYAWGGGWLRGINLQVFEHSGCVSTANAAGDILQSWSCTPSGYTKKELIWPPNETWKKAVIRNNTTGSSSYFTAGYYCYNQC